jgi:hypothetical protein
VAALVASVAGLFFVLACAIQTIDSGAGSDLYESAAFRLGLHVLLIAAFALAIVSLVLRTHKILGFTAITVTLLATILGGSRLQSHTGELSTGVFLGLDWFVLNVIFTGFFVQSRGSFSPRIRWLLLSPMRTVLLRATNTP